jgi:hypothetical protein
MRQLKHHEQKLLKKVNFFQWKAENNVREIKVLRRYHVQDRDDYVRYNKLAGLVTKLTSQLKDLPHDVSFFCLHALDMFLQEAFPPLQPNPPPGLSPSLPSSHCVLFSITTPSSSLRA